MFSIIVLLNILMKIIYVHSANILDLCRRNALFHFFFLYSLTLVHIYTNSDDDNNSDN